MNKQAQGFTMGRIFGVIIAIIVLALVIFAAITLSGKENNFISNIPGFGQGKVAPADVGQIRYNVTNSALQYYDGVSWHLFTNEKASFGDIELSESSLKPAIENYYFSSNSRTKRQVLYDSSGYAAVASYLAQSEGGLQGFFFTNSQYKKGDVVIELWSEDANKKLTQIYSGGYYVYSALGNILYAKQGTKSPYTSNDESTLMLKAETWKASVFKNPLTLSYKQGTTAKSDKFCASFSDRTYILVDLAKPTISTTC